jgi:rfaE bifunctional protein kinase chain/domain
LKKQGLHKLFDSFNKVKALVIGDMMLDSYFWGEVNRISPEAPVPVVAVDRKENRLGGAGNVALNLCAMGATSIICSIVGKDDSGARVLKMMKENNLPAEGIISVTDRPTTTKTRILSSSHHLIRVDEEVDENINTKTTARLIDFITGIIEKRGADIIVLEDYDKGVITLEMIDRVTALAKKRKIPIAVDPKKRNFNKYHDVTLFKPNLKELKEGMVVDIQATETGQLKMLAEQLRKERNIEMVMVTLSEHGVFISSEKETKVIPAHIRNIADVSGAGDTVISLAALCMALKLDAAQTAFLSNLAGGQVCERAGVTPVNKAQLLEEALSLSANS